MSQPTTQDGVLATIDLAMPTFNVRRYGATGDGTTDDSTAVLAAITAAQVAGGEVLFPAGTYRVNSQIVFTNDGATPPKQQSVTLRGAAPHFSGRATAPVGGSILDLRYAGRSITDAVTTDTSTTLTSATGAFVAADEGREITGIGIPLNTHIATVTNGTTVTLSQAATASATVTATILRPKILTTGLGLLTIQDLTLADLGTGSNPFLATTNTTLQIQRASFYGNKAGLLADQDAIILGGTKEVEGGGGLNDGFQGYGTVIANNYFNKIRRAVYGRTFANAVVVRDNCLWNQCGSNLAGGAGIEFDNPAVAASQADAGNVIAGNLIEIAYYPYGIRIGKGVRNSIIGNNAYDSSATTVAAVRIGTAGSSNTVINGYLPSTIDDVSNEGGDANNTTIIGASITYPSYLPYLSTLALQLPYTGSVETDASNMMFKWGGTTKFRMNSGGNVYPGADAVFNTGNGCSWTGWLAYLSGSSWYLRDTTNSVMVIKADKGATNTSVVTFAGRAKAAFLSATALPTYADNAAATAGGLAVGDFYMTATGQVMVRY